MLSVGRWSWDVRVRNHWRVRGWSVSVNLGLSAHYIGTVLLVSVPTSQEKVTNSYHKFSVHISF